MKQWIFCAKYLWKGSELKHYFYTRKGKILHIPFLQGWLHEKLGLIQSHENSYRRKAAQICTCQKNVAYNRSPLNHQNTHIEIIKSFPCKFCEKRFALKSRLVRQSFIYTKVTCTSAEFAKNILTTVNHSQVMCENLRKRNHTVVPFVTEA